MAKYTREQIEKAVKAKGYVWFADAGNKGYDVNIIGIRNSAPGARVTNVFDDNLTLSYRVKGDWTYKEWDSTTDPGTKGVMEFSNKAGVARLVPGQYINAYTLGLHQGKYEALRQVKPVKVYRDANKDAIFDTKLIQEGIFGINIHKAGANSTYVENWSEGCQVFKKSADFEEFMAIVRKAAALHGENFSYTLLDSKDII